MKFLSELNSRLRIATGRQAREEDAATGPVVVVYHSVVDKRRGDGLDDYVISQERLDSHLRFFKSRGRIVPLSDVLTLLRNHSPLPSPCYVVTFDDALQCQLTFAKQVLDSHEVPWTLAVPAGSVDSGRSIWSYELRFLIRHCWSGSTFPSPTGGGVQLPARNATELQHVTRIVFDHLVNRCSAVERRDYLDQLIDSVGRSKFQGRLAMDPRFRMATWEELRSASHHSVEVASHGWGHVPHLACEDPLIVRNEIIASRDTITRNLGITPCVFAYPHGVAASDSDPILKEAGYTCGLTTEPRRIDPEDNPMRIPRFNAEYSLPVLRRHLSRPFAPGAR